MSWRVRSAERKSLGSQSARAVSLGDIHRRRQESMGQFFTPDWVAKGIWKSFKSVTRRKNQAPVSVFDCSVGSGALFEGADVKNTVFYGVDNDAGCIDDLCHDANQADITFEFHNAGMESVIPEGFDFAVINPPYSLTIQSPSLMPYECTSFGRYGPCTSALSHEYALDMALDCAEFVAALLPVSMDEVCRSNERLQYVLTLPGTAFDAEGASVKTAVYLFGRRKVDRVIEMPMEQGDKWPALEGFLMGYHSRPKCKIKGVDVVKPTITLPVTGQTRVELHHHNRQIVLKYECGLVQARVANGLLQREAFGKRLPKSIWYSGDGRLNLDVLLLQEDPVRAFDQVLHMIKEHGGDPRVSPTLRGYFRKLVKRHQRAMVPMHRTVLAKSDGRISLKARRGTLLDPRDFNSVSIAKGTELSCRREDGEFVVSYNGDSAHLRQDELATRYEVLEADEEAGEWVVMHPGLEPAYPEIGLQHRRRIQSLGVDDWLADFQVDSLVEGMISPYGYIGGWEQGSGKARYAIALALMHSGRSMIVLDSGLLPEMLIEITEKIGLTKTQWRVLKKGDQITTKISIVTYATLRGTTEWRRKVNTLICDEGGVLSNTNTQQTRAVRQMAARKMIILDGTVISNYPRDVLPLSVATAGNGVAHQRYGVNGKAEVSAQMFNSTCEVQRGEDAFYDNHVVTQWVTNEFREDLQSGSKREIPKIANLPLFRRWLAPNIQRRLRSEPALAEFSNCPDPVKSVHSVQWDPDHLAHYLTIATDFAQWYQNQKKDMGRSLNLVTVLARIGAVQRAANSPHVVSKSTMTSYTPITSKQRAVIKQVKRCVKQGRKFIVYAKSPDVLARLHKLLNVDGVNTVLFTGKQNIRKRSQELHYDFRFGTAHGLLSSWVGQRGLNLEQGKEVIFYERSWSATVEEQAIFRTQRPSQTDEVKVRYNHLEGSIDEYCAQMVMWKGRAAAAGLDFGEQIDDESEFVHLDTLLSRFCKDIMDMSVHDAKNQLTGIRATG